MSTTNGVASGRAYVHGGYGNLRQPDPVQPTSWLPTALDNVHVCLAAGDGAIVTSVTCIAGEVA